MDGVSCLYRWCWVRFSAERESESELSFVEYVWVSIEPGEGNAGRTRRVEIVSLPPVGVNLHALLLIGGMKPWSQEHCGGHSHLARLVMICLSLISSPTTIPQADSPLSLSEPLRRCWISSSLWPWYWYAARLATCAAVRIFRHTEIVVNLINTRIKVNDKLQATSIGSQL